ncbi:ras suppressor protein 1-like [Panonychus citri]|uniref:ras suppressor protein 1-like n=1 Tax=Panonychus citri TaxID=50023 RepID=UPI0023076E80|nr:ras suppressor protein 1-like [Panonychus citri]
MMTLSKSCLPSNNGCTPKSTAKHKILDENENEANLSDRGINSMEELPRIFYLNNITRLTLSHNKIRSIPPSISNMTNLESLNLFNNQIDELPTAIVSLPKLKILNVGMNRLYNLPRGFGDFPALEVLDLTYNNLDAKCFPNNFYTMETLRALYLGDNDFEYLPADIGQLKNLLILCLRDNDLLTLPREIGQLTRIRELHIQNNRLSALPPELGNLDLCSNRSVCRMEGNPWIPQIADQLQIGVSHVIDFIRQEAYKFLYSRSQGISSTAVPPRNDERKSKKISRVRVK